MDKFSKLNIEYIQRWDIEKKMDYFYEFSNKSMTLSKRYHWMMEVRREANKLLLIYNGTSETNILVKILALYELISEYYPTAKPIEELSKNELLLIQDKCKYFVHLIVVLFHLNQIDKVRSILRAFESHLNIFGDHIQRGYKELYKNALELFKSFTHISVFSDRGVFVNIFNRLGFQPYEMSNISFSESRKLNKAVIVGSCSTQTPFKGFTIDMFRISQCIEFKVGSTTNVKNARKYMFYNTAFWDVEISVNNAIHSLSRNGILLFYISGDGFENKSIVKNKNPLYTFGIKMKQDADETVEHPKVECLYPGDVSTFLVVPTILIIDSECSSYFKELYRHTEEPFMCLMSPSSYPDFIELSNNGKLFTMFISSPQTAFCWVCHQRKVPSTCWEELVSLMNEFMFMCLRIIDRWYRKYDSSKLSAFMDDRFSRVALLRFMFCLVTLRLHEEFLNEDFYPKSNFASLESEVLANKQLQSIIYRMASVVGGSACFANSSDLSSTNESIDVEK